MGANDFTPGYLDYRVAHQAVDFKDYSWDKWQFGFLAFSRMERRFDEKSDPALIPSLIEGKKQRTDDGFLMEMNLWGSPKEGVFKEIVLEREDASFYVQEWTLSLGIPADKTANCYVVKAKTSPPTKKNDPNKAEKSYLFNPGELVSYEIICPDHRLHVFLTTGAQH